jgi:hypothetical protein
MGFALACHEPARWRRQAKAIDRLLGGAMNLRVLVEAQVVVGGEIDQPAPVDHSRRAGAAFMQQEIRANVPKAIQVGEKIAAAEPAAATRTATRRPYLSPSRPLLLGRPHARLHVFVFRRRTLANT